MGTQTTTTMTTKRSRRRTPRGAAKDAGTPAGNLNARALYRLMAWLSPAYPVGAFSYSSGIEWAVEAGDITDAATLERWLAVMIADGSGFCDAVFFAHAHRAAAERDDEGAARGRRARRGLRAVEGATPGNDGAGPRLPRCDARGLADAGARSAAGGLGRSRRAAGRGRRCERGSRHCARARAARLISTR